MLTPNNQHNCTYKVLVWPWDLYSQNKKKITCSSFILPQDVFSGQSSGTSIWVLQVSLSYQKVHLLANQHITSLFWNWLYSYQRQSQPSLVTPQRAERYDFHLALWLPESTCNRGQQGLMGQGWAAQHLPQGQGAWPALAEKCFYDKGRKKCLNLRAVREKTKLLAVNVYGGV